MNDSTSMQPTVVNLVEVYTVTQVAALDIGQSFLLARDASRLDAALSSLSGATLRQKSLGGAIVTVIAASGSPRVLSFSVRIPEEGELVWVATVGALIRYTATAQGNQWRPFDTLPQRITKSSPVFESLDSDRVYDFYASMAGGVLDTIRRDALALARARKVSDCPDALLSRVAEDLLASPAQNFTESDIRDVAKISVGVKKETGSSVAANSASAVFGLFGGALATYRKIPWPCLQVRFRRWKLASNATRQPFQYFELDVKSSSGGAASSLKCSIRPPTAVGGIYVVDDKTVWGMADAFSWHSMFYLLDGDIPVPGTTLTITRRASSRYKVKTSTGTLSPAFTMTVTVAEGDPASAAFCRASVDAICSVTLSGSAVQTGVYTIPANYRGSYRVAPTVLFRSTSGTGAAATVNFSGGRVTSINVTSGGSGYTDNPEVVFVGDVSSETFMLNLRDCLQANLGSDLYVDVGTANTVMPWGYTRDGNASSSAAPTTAGPDAPALSEGTYVNSPTGYWPNGSRVLRVRTQSGSEIEPIGFNPSVRVPYVAKYKNIMGVTDIDDMCPEVNKDLYDQSSGTANPISVDSAVIHGGFEIYKDVNTGSAVSRTFPDRPGLTFWRARITGTDSAGFVDGRPGVNPSAEQALLKPAGQTEYTTSTP